MALNLLAIALFLASSLSGQQGTAQFAGCPIFTPGDFYNARVDNARIDPRSAQYIAGAVSAGNTDGFWMAAPAARFVNVADKNTPRKMVLQKVPYHRFPAPIPWSAAFQIERINDAHAIVIDKTSCRLYELYSATSNGSLSAYSGATWDLRSPFKPLPAGNPSSMASGLSLFAGMVKWEEIKAGHVDHVLNWAPPAGTTAQYDFVRPASDTDGHTFRAPGAPALPYGAHLRLKRSFDISRFGPQSKIIAQAMKSYGIVLADTDTEGNALYNAAPMSGPDQWDRSDLAALGSIHISDFEVLALPPVQRIPGH